MAGDIRNRVLDLLSDEPRSVSYLCGQLGLAEKQVRNAIDGLRIDVVPVWWSPRMEGFWIDDSGWPLKGPGVRGNSSRWAKDP